MIILGSALTVLAMLLIGLVLFSALCRVTGDPQTNPTGPDLLLTGLLPGLALVSCLVTILALVHLLRNWVLVSLAILLVAVLRREARQVVAAFAEGAAAVRRSVVQGDLSVPVAVLAGVIVVYVGLFSSLLPNGNVDVWVYHVPLALSIAEHSGFVYPQFGNVFYASQPILLETLAGAGMTLVQHFALAGVISLAFYFSMLLLLLSFAKRARGLMFLLLCYLFVWYLPFTGVATPMIDVPRSCLSVSAFLFAYRYACDFRRLDLVLSALMAGFAVASKTTELITPLIICATLAPLIWRRGSWRDLVPAAGAFIAISSYWYVKNLILYGNPVYPFLFAHPGLSDAYMADYMRSMAIPFDPADRVYSTNLLTWRGWHDFFVNMWAKFDWLFWFAVAALAGQFLPMARRWMLPLWTIVLFVIWYAIMFNGIRWATTAIYLAMTSGFLVVAFVVDWFCERWLARNFAKADARSVPDWLLRRALWLAGIALLLASASLVFGIVGGHWRLVSWATPAVLLSGFLVMAFTVDRLLDLWEGPLEARAWLSRRGPGVASAALVLALCGVGFGLVEGYGRFIPTWLDRDLLFALTRSGDPDEYLRTTRPGYALYRYIHERHLAYVLQPYDNGGYYYVSAYNGGAPDTSVLVWNDMPATADDLRNFLARKKVHYFIKPDRITSTIEMLGTKHVALANQITAKLQRRSRLLLTDGFGNDLYEIGPEATR